MKVLNTVIGVAIFSFSLVGCSQHLSSAERHAKHFVYASKSDFDPNYQTRMQETVRVSVPLFEQFYQQGKKDKLAGVSREQAQQQADYFSSPAFLDAIQRESEFAGKKYSQSQNQKWRLLMSQEAAGAYLDGYEGRK